MTKCKTILKKNLNKNIKYAERAYTKRRKFRILENISVKVTTRKRFNVLEAHREYSELRDLKR